jgi:TPR repeat protein
MLAVKNGSLKVLFLLIFGLLLTSCASVRSGHEAFAQDTPHDKGVRYLLGHGVPQNNEKAFYWFNKAAADDDPFAENELAYMYATGKGVTRDPVQALHWYQKAANHGLSSAQYNLGLLYLHGIGTPRNKELALQWFQKSAQLGFEPAMTMLKNDQP